MTVAALLGINREAIESRKHRKEAEKYAAEGHFTKAGEEYARAADAIEDYKWQSAAMLYAKAAIAYLQLPKTINASWAFREMLHLIRENDEKKEKELVGKVVGMLRKTKNRFINNGNFEFVVDTLLAEGDLVRHTAPERAVALEDCTKTCKALEKSKWRLWRKIDELLPRDGSKGPLSTKREETLSKLLHGDFKGAAKSITQAAGILQSLDFPRAGQLLEEARQCREADADKKNLIMQIQ
jgi:hypothetical protein